MNRTVLQIARDAAYKLSIDPPEALFASADRTEQELGSVMNEVAARIVRAHDWSLLKKEQTYIGDGATEGYDLPSDYLRMPKETQIWSTRWQHPLLQVTPEDQLQLDVREFDIITTTWTIYGGQMRFKPALAVNENARWWYVSDTAIQRNNGTFNGRIEADTDVFRLGCRLLELHLIAEMRMRKGFDYEMDMMTAQTALAQKISEDRGARIVTQAQRRSTRAKTAYPWSIVP
jgi:hypothetical protein